MTTKCLLCQRKLNVPPPYSHSVVCLDCTAAQRGDDYQTPSIHFLEIDQAHFDQLWRGQLSVIAIASTAFHVGDFIKIGEKASGRRCAVCITQIMVGGVVASGASVLAIEKVDVRVLDNIEPELIARWDRWKAAGALQPEVIWSD